MKTNRIEQRRRGMTLIEMTVAIIVLLAFLTMTFIGVRAWKRGSDRAACLMNIRHVQQALRGHANMNGLVAGDPLVPPDEPERTVIGPNTFIPSMPRCPGRGMYRFSGPLVPPIGELFMTCSLGDDDGHRPEEFGSW